MSDFNRPSAIWARQDHVGLLTHIAFFAGPTIVLNGIIFGLGMDRSADAATRLSWAPPGWAIGAIWVALFALYAVAHWLLLQRGETGRRAAGWVRAIAIWDLAYPFLTNGFDLRLGAWLNVITVLLTILLLWRVWQDSRIAFGWLLPSLIWVCFATALTIVALQGVK